MELKAPCSLHKGIFSGSQAELPGENTFLTLSPRHHLDSGWLLAESGLPGLGAASRGKAGPCKTGGSEGAPLWWLQLQG